MNRLFYHPARFLRRAFLPALAGLALVHIASVARAATIGAQDRAASRSFVYTITNPNGENAIAAYERDPQTGALTFRATYPTGGRGSGQILDSQSPLVVNDAGTCLYAVNAASNQISAMSIARNGSLEVVGVYASRGIEPCSLALHGDLLYVANKGDGANAPNYAGFRVSVDGTLTRIKRLFELNIGDNPTQILFNRAGNLVIGLRFGGRLLDCFTIVQQNGKLRPLAQLNNQTGPFAGVFNPLDDTQLIVSDARLPGAVSYMVTGQGQLNQLTAVRNSPNRAACWIAVHHNGLHLWLANTGTNTLSLYTIAGGGALNFISDHSTLAFGRAPFEIALDSNGQFLYELNTGGGNQSIHVLRVTLNPENGGLEDLAPVNLPAGSAPAGLVVLDPQ